MKAIRDLEDQGYAAKLEGGRIQVRRKECFNPDAKAVNVLLQEIQGNREEAVRYLNQCRMSVWCDSRGVPRWISWSACGWHKEKSDPACYGCDPLIKKMKPMGMTG